MFDALYNALLDWNRNSSDRAKMQHMYIVIVVVSLIVSGIVSLLDASLGRDMLVVTVAAGAVFLVNAVLWSLLDSVVLTRLSNRRKK